MALRGLVEGDCGGQNPLTKLRGYYSQEQGRGVHRPGQLDGHFANRADGHASEQTLIDEYLQETQRGGVRAFPTSFRMDSLLQELRHTEGVAGPVDQQQSMDAWANEFSISAQKGTDWSKQFLSETTLPQRNHMLTQKPLQPGWGADYLSQVPLVHSIPGPQHHLDAVEYEAFVSALDNQRTLGTTDPWSESLQENAEAILQAEDINAQQGTADQASRSAQWADEFVSLAKAELRDHVQPNSDAYKQEYWKKLQEEWNEALSADDQDLELPPQYEPFSEYQFQENNPTAHNGNALEEGKIKLKEGDLPSAVLLFETAAQEHPDSVEAWQLLGTSQAENEQDPQAICALKKCLSLDPGNLTALMCLAVSCTNESYQSQACQALQLWLQYSPDYQHTVHRKAEDNITFKSSFMTQEMHDKTAELYIQAARMRQGSDLDPNIQTGLGVLFNLSNDYDKAVDCFRAALSANPTDSLLWNRLGATLANGNRSEEAVAAYHNALRQSPGYVRCRYNLGISCINLKAYTEAAEHFLTALNFQATGRGPQGKDSGAVMSESIWSSLRLAVSLINKPQVKEMADRKDLEGLSAHFNINISS